MSHPYVSLHWSKSIHATVLDLYYAEHAWSRVPRANSGLPLHTNLQRPGVKICYERVASKILDMLLMTQAVLNSGV